MSWKAFWILAVVYLLLAVYGWLTDNGALALVAAFLAAYQLWETYTGRSG